MTGTKRPCKLCGVEIVVETRHGRDVAFDTKLVRGESTTGHPSAFRVQHVETCTRGQHLRDRIAKKDPSDPALSFRRYVTEI